MPTSPMEYLTVEDGVQDDLHAGYVSVAQITIDAPASAVWPHVLDIGSWILDFHFEHIAGDVNAEGEIKYLWAAGAEFPSGSITIDEGSRTADNALVLKTLKIVPEKLWYGVNLPKQEGGVRTTGVNLVLLGEMGGRTVVTAIRSKEAVCRTQETREATQQQMAELQPIAQLRWTNKYLPRLKQLAESSHRQS